MTPDQLTALADRISARHVARDDLLAAADYLRQCAQAEPVSWRYEVRGDNADGRSATEWHLYGTYDDRERAESHLSYCGNGIEGRVVPLYTSPQPQQAGAPKYTEGHCERRQQPGGCDLHNLHCQYPACDRRPAAAPQPPSAQADAVERECVPSSGDEALLKRIGEPLVAQGFGLCRAEMLRRLQEMRK